MIVDSKLEQIWRYNRIIRRFIEGEDKQLTERELVAKVHERWEKSQTAVLVDPAE